MPGRLWLGPLDNASAAIRRGCQCRIAAMFPADRIKGVLDATPAVRLAIVFGSAARQSDRRTSDIDVGVSWFGGTEPAGGTLAVDLERAAGRRVDLVSLDNAPPLLRFEIARGGMVLVERVPRAWVDFRARAMIDWWDWAPTSRMMHRVMAQRVREEAGRGPA
jgi:predicted nucleotidyltransferase